MVSHSSDSHVENQVSSSSSSEFHPALVVTDIKNYIPVLLDMKQSCYSHWCQLFEILAHAYNDLDHIDNTVPRPSDVSPSLWLRLDSTVKIWMYGTISDDLRNSVLCKGASARQTWTHIKNIFQNNKSTRAVYLEDQFNKIHIRDFSSVNEFCAKLKTISDQLANLDQPVSDQKLVLRRSLAYMAHNKTQ